MSLTRALLFLLFSTGFSFTLNETCANSLQYYDSTLLACAFCPYDQMVDPTGLGCKCLPGMAKTEATRDLPNFQCAACTAGVPSSDQYVCQLCPPTGVNNTQHECVCPAGSAIQEMADDGSYLSQKVCMQCATNDYRGQWTYSCQACPSPGMNRTAANNYACVCDTTQHYVTAGSGCVTSSDLSNIDAQYPLNQAIQVTYTDEVSSTGIGTYSLSVSDTFSYYYYEAADGCWNYQSEKHCQILANLCVLQMYNLQMSVCKLFQYIGSTRSSANAAYPDPGWKQGMPFLYYGDNPSDILTRSATMTVSFGTSGSGLLDFRLAMYTMNGTFIGFKQLTDDLILCPHSSADTQRYREFGTNVQIECTLDVTPFLTYPDTIFYEMYMVDSGVLVDVPVLIKNLHDSTGNTPNTGGQSSWQLVRRFFIYDNISGKVGNGAYSSGATTTILSYLISAKLTVNLKTSADERIYIPYFTLEYRSLLTSSIQSRSNLVSTTFSSEYTMDIGNFLQVAVGVLALAHVIAFFACIVRVYVWTKNNPSAISRDTYIFWLCGKGIMIFLGTWTFIIFWYMFLLCGYWFVFFKMQYHVFVLLPPANDPQSYKPFAAIVALLIFLHIITVFDLVRTQSKIDFFFIDWESPNRVLRPGTDQLRAIAEEVRGEPPKQDFYKLTVSAWRSLFLANELNELQVLRYVNIEFTLLFTVFFLK